MLVNKPPSFITVVELAHILQVSPATAYRLVNEGNFEAAKFRGSIRISVASVERYIQEEFETFRFKNGLKLDD